MIRLICLLLAGCATPWVWQHPQGLGQAELRQAIADCQQLAQDEVDRYDYYTPSFSPYFPPYGGSFYYRHYYDFYYYPPTYYYDTQRRLNDQQRFFRVCMYSKGWRQVPVTPPPR